MTVLDMILVVAVSFAAGTITQQWLSERADKRLRAAEKAERDAEREAYNRSVRV